MYSKKILNFQESTILNACTKKSGNLLKAPLIKIKGKWKNQTLTMGLVEIFCSLFKEELLQNKHFSVLQFFSNWEIDKIM